MPESIGAHLLGRKPSPPDERDYRLTAFLAGTTAAATLTDDQKALLAALVVLEKSHAARATKAWSEIATRILVPQAPAPPQPTAATEWANAETVLDQGDYGTCVGNGYAQFGNTLPVDDKFGEKDARAIYYEATIIDGSPDNPDAPGGGQQGATVRSGAKAMKNRGRINAYAFAASVDEAIAWLIKNGPVVAGTNWTSGMFTPTSAGYVHPTGEVEGGHCYLLTGWDPGKEAIKFLNSWGSGWGEKGYFFMKKSEFEQLFAEDGELVAAIELP